MPRVPTINNTQVRTSALPNVLQSPAPDAAVSGALNQVGQTIQQVGGVVANIVAEEQQKANQAAVFDALNGVHMYEGERIYGDDGVLNARGRSAFEASDQLWEEYDQRISTIADGLGNDVQRAAFRRQADAMRTTSFRRVERHVSSERQRYEQATYEASAAGFERQAIGSAADPALWDDGEIAVNQGLMAVNNLTRDLSPEARREAREQYLSGIRVRSIEQMLAAGDHELAQQYFDEFGDDILSDRRASVTKAIGRAGQQDRAEQANALRTEFNELIQTDPEAAKQLFESEAAKQLIPADERASDVDRARRANGASIIRYGRNELREQLAADVVDPQMIAAEVDRLVAAAAAHPDVRIDDPDSALSGVGGLVDASEDDVRQMMLLPEFERARQGALAGDHRALEQMNALADLLPDTIAGRKARLQAQAAVETINNKKGSTVGVDGRAGEIINLMLQGDFSAESMPRDKAARDKADDRLSAMGYDLAERAAMFAQTNAQLPSSVRNDFKALVDDAEFDLPAAMEVLAAINLHNPRLARNLARDARSGRDNGFVESVLNLHLHDRLTAAELSTLNDPRAIEVYSAIFSENLRNYHADERDQRVVAAFADSGPVEVSSEHRDLMEDAGLLGATVRLIGQGQTSIEDMNLDEGIVGSAFLSSGINAVRNAYRPMPVYGRDGLVLMPAEMLITDGGESLDGAFHGAINLVASIYPDKQAMPDRAVLDRTNNRWIIPIVDQDTGVPHAFAEWSVPDRQMLDAYSAASNSEAFNNAMDMLFGGPGSDEPRPIARVGDLQQIGDEQVERPQTVFDDPNAMFGGYMISPSEPANVPVGSYPTGSTIDHGFGVIGRLPPGAVRGFIELVKAGRGANVPSPGGPIMSQLSHYVRSLGPSNEDIDAFVSDHLRQTFGDAETPAEAFSEELMKETVEALPALLLLQGANLPTKAGEFVTSQLGRFLNPATARAVGGSMSAMVGAAEFSAASDLPEAIQENDPLRVAEAALRPFANIATGTGKIATGRIDEVRIDEWVDIAFAALGAASGFMRRPLDAQAVRASRAEAVDVLSRVPDEQFSRVSSEVESAGRVSADARNEMRSIVREAQASRAERSGVRVVENQPGGKTASPAKSGTASETSQLPAEAGRAESVLTRAQQQMDQNIDRIEAISTQLEGGVEDAALRAQLEGELNDLAAQNNALLAEHLGGNPVEQLPRLPGDPSPKAKEPWQMTRSEFEASEQTNQQVAAGLADLRTGMSREQQIGFLVDELGVEGISPSSIAERFFQTAFPTFNQKLKEDFLRHLEKVSGMKVGDVLSTGRNNEVLETVDSPFDLIRAMGWGDDISRLDGGGQKGLAAIMASISQAVESGRAISASSYKELIDEAIGVERTEPGQFARGDATTHRREVERAASEGKPVPPEVLAEYPEIAAQYAGNLPPVPHERLPGGREAGGTTIIPEVADELTGFIARTARRINDAGLGAYRLGQQTVMRGADFIEIQGETGARIAGDVRLIDRKARERAKAAEVEINDAMRGLNRQQRIQTMQLLNERIEPDLLNDIPAFIRERADRVRAILDGAMLDPARDLGFERMLPGGQRIPVGGSGKAFPQVPNAAGRALLDEAAERGLASARVYRWAEQIVESGGAENLEGALAKINQIREQQMRGVVPYLERTRVELPVEYVEWDPLQVLPAVLERGALTIEGARLWGTDFKKLDALLTRLATETEPAIAMKIDRFLKHAFGRGGEVSSAQRNLWGAVSNYQTTMKLGASLLSAMRNSLQRFGNTIDYPLPVILKAAAKYPPFINPFIKEARKIRRELERMGVIASTSDLGVIETGLPGERLTQLALRPFTAAETGNQVTTALIARYGVERDIKRLIAMEGTGGRTSRLVNIMQGAMGESREAIMRRMQRRGLTTEQVAEMVASGRPLSYDELQAVMDHMVLDTQFPITLSTKPLWWDNNPFLRVLFKFKTFGTRQVGLIYNTVFKEMSKGNVAPFLQFTAAMILIGELYNIARDYVVGDEQSLTASMINRPDRRTAKGIATRLLANLADGGGVGIMSDLLYGIGDMVLGPVGSTMENLSEAALDVRRRPSNVINAVKEFGRRELAITRQVGILERLDKKLFNENNNYIDYRIWRRRAFEFREQREGTSAIGRALDQAIAGFPDFERSGNALTYDYAARQVTVGDWEDAADYLADLYRSTPRDQWDEIDRGIKLSMKAKSPLGPVAVRDQAEFLRAFDPEQRVAARQLQRDWLRDYERAAREAKRRARSEE